MSKPQFFHSERFDRYIGYSSELELRWLQRFELLPDVAEVVDNPRPIPYSTSERVAWRKRPKVTQREWIPSKMLRYVDGSKEAWSFDSATGRVVILTVLAASRVEAEERERNVRKS